VRDLDENAGAVARRRIRADGTAMLEITEHAEGVGDEAVRSSSFHVGDKADSTGIFLECGIEEPLSLGAFKLVSIARSISHVRTLGAL
jgi:hypothetical protein